ncbi:hypothetical protein [Ferdinandcohnia sp. SAFN-114]|uniref:hypothetical protein n=1 Tax=Ferdinandcohnia sp. SAFN-114 TaxID=3387275 RepID=UPI003F80E6EF
MKKLIGLLVGVSLAFTFLILPQGQTFASNVSLEKDISTQATYSRYVEYETDRSGNWNPPSYYYYKDNFGYAGSIPLISKRYYPDLNFTQVKYGGYIYCQGTCLIP